MPDEEELGAVDDFPFDGLALLDVECPCDGDGDGDEGPFVVAAMSRLDVVWQTLRLAVDPLRKAAGPLATSTGGCAWRPGASGPRSGLPEKAPWGPERPGRHIETAQKAKRR